LGADNKLPHINIFHFDGKCIKVGNANQNVVDGIKITGINVSHFFIYTLRWTEKELVWLINDLEVYRTASNIPSEEMYMVSTHLSLKTKRKRRNFRGGLGEGVSILNLR